ncbi:MAG: hypothetical protein JWR18_1912 [Segetibacter sp.]|nr:hypothetical protein [Segetibacter sp.]
MLRVVLTAQECDARKADVCTMLATKEISFPQLAWQSKTLRLQQVRQ